MYLKTIVDEHSGFNFLSPTLATVVAQAMQGCKRLQSLAGETRLFIMVDIMREIRNWLFSSECLKYEKLLLGQLIRCILCFFCMYQNLPCVFMTSD